MDTDEYTDRNFEYTVFNHRGECILRIGRNEDEGEYENLSPQGTRFVGGYEYEQ